MKRMMLLLALGASALMAQRVRVVHASPDAPNVDVYVDGQIAVEDLPFGDYTDYLTVPSGQRNFAVFLAGTQTKVLEASPNVAPGQDFTVVAAGFAGKAPALRLLLLNDASGNATDGQTRVRVVHASPSAPAVDVYFTSPYVARRNVPPVLTGVPFGVGSGYLTIPGGQYQARVTPAGTQTVAINSGRLVIPQGSVRTIIAVDAKGGGAPLGAIVLLDRN